MSLTFFNVVIFVYILASKLKGTQGTPPPHMPPPYPYMPPPPQTVHVVPPMGSVPNYGATVTVSPTEVIVVGGCPTCKVRRDFCKETVLVLVVVEDSDWTT